MIKVTPFIYNDEDDLCANTYLLYDEDMNCVVIDPSSSGDGISKYIRKNNLNLRGVLLTHGHFDHIRGVDRLINDFNCPLYIFYLDEVMLYDFRLNCSSLMSYDAFTLKAKATTLKDNEVLKLLSEDIITVWTPFHSEGSVCFYLKESKILISGDTLFAGSIGRDDLPHSCRKKKEETLNKLKHFDDDVKVYPGHGPSTTMGSEKKYNPYLR